LVLALYKFANRKYGFKFGFPSRKPVAQALHKQMYGAFAAADTTTLRRITCDGLYESFSSRIYSRPKFERWEWELVKYNGRPKVVSDRAASLGIEGCGIRQVVVRIPSRQRLTRYNRRGEVVEGTGKEKDTVEFVVIQKKLWHGKEEDWRVWGTTEETTYERVLENRKKELD
jgi:protein MBA1